MSSNLEELDQVLLRYLKSPETREPQQHALAPRTALKAREPNVQPVVRDPVDLAVGFINEILGEMRSFGAHGLDSSTLRTIALCLEAVERTDPVLHISKTLEACKVFVSSGMLAEPRVLLERFFCLKTRQENPSLEDLLRNYEIGDFGPKLDAEYIMVVLELILGLGAHSTSRHLPDIIIEKTSPLIASLDRQQRLKLLSLLSQFCTAEQTTESLKLRYYALMHIEDAGTEFLLATILHFERVCDASVYSSTADVFYNLCSSWARSQRSLRPLQFLVHKYHQLKPTSCTLKWETAIYQQALPPALDDHISYLLTTLDLTDTGDRRILLKALELERPIANESLFVASVCRVIKGLDFTLKADQQLVLALLECSKNTSPCLNVYDMTTILIKDLDPLVHSGFEIKALSVMTEVLKHQNQPKRLRNFSNLLFHYGGKLLTKNESEALRCWHKCLYVEDILVEQNADEFGQLKNKVERMLNMLIETKKYAHSYDIIMHVFQSFEQLHRGWQVEKYQDELIQTFGILIKLVARMIVRMDSKLPVKILGAGDKTRAFVTIELIKILTSMKPSRRDQISALIVQVKNELQDNGLFLYFLSSISMIIEFGLALKSIEALNFETNSVMSGYRDIIVCHIYLLQCCSQMDEELLMKSLAAVLSWAKTKRAKVSVYELEVLTMVIRVLNYSDLTDYASYLLEVARQNADFGDSDLGLRMEAAYLKLQLNLPDEALKLLDEVPNTALEAARHKMLKTECYLLLKDDAAQEECAELLSLFKSEQLQLSKQSNKLNVSTLLMLAASVSMLMALFHREKNKLESVLNLKQSIRVLQSVMKNFLVTDGSSIEIDLCHKSTLKMQFVSLMLQAYSSLAAMMLELGLAKDFEYYAAELEKVLTHQSSLVLKSRYFFRLAKYHVYRNDLAAAKEVLDKATRCSQKMQFESFQVEFEKLSAYELFYQMADSKDVHAIRDKVDMFFRLLAEHEIDGGKFYQQVVYELRLGRSLANEKNFIAFLRMFLPMNGREKTSMLKTAVTNMKEMIIQTVNQDLENIFAGDSVVVMKEGAMDNMYAACLRECAKFVNEPRLVSEDISKGAISVLLASGACSRTNLESVLMQNELMRYESLEYDRKLNLAIENTRQLVPLVCQPDYRVSVSQPHDLASVLPLNWVTVCLDLDMNSGCLVLTRYVPKQDPVFLKLPLERHLIGRHASFGSAVQELEAIIQESDRTTRIEVTSMVKTKADRANWWAQRKSLDRKLKQLLCEMDSHWFGCFKGVFGRFVFEKAVVEETRVSLERILSKHVGHSISLGAFDTELILQLDLDLETVASDVEDWFQHIQISDEADYGRLFLEIEPELRRVRPTFTIDHTVLVVSPECVKLPWESMPFLRTRSVSRMPSIKMLVDVLVEHADHLSLGVPVATGYYVINPGGDLKRTETNFSKIFAGRRGWEGIIGSRPSEEQISQGLQKDLYVYVGHGGGEQYIRSKTVKSMAKLPPALLLGCSSGKLKTQGVFKPHGTVYNYLIGGSPMVVANLWDVTDKDIDKFTLHMFEKWGLSGRSRGDIGHSIAQSRDACVLPYLNGAAPVLYGLPFKIRNEL
ncbi:hypothetical protein KL933_000061 [Ogataea haglerorum]|uniref:separase n=1 Tax=Ogataea haglerorum TaxID=1937702 RepID=A0AAN6I268_9ASCO|nr:hypothetical protein KL933_000061 [Ogataea haglerorum]